ncbi:MAG: glycosyltransferase family 4 protein [Chloroflexi bacterium]|nr:glycosyltransferase family 4 protein [Chloroflexota bacterium]
MPIHLGWPAELRRFVAKRLIKWTMSFEFSSGVYGEEYFGAERMRLLAKRADVRFRTTRRPYPASFRLYNPGLEARRVQISLDGKRLFEVKVAGQSKSMPYCVVIGGSAKGEQRLRLDDLDGQSVERIVVGPALAQAASHLRLCDFHVSTPGFSLYQRLFENWLPHWRDRLLNPLPEDAQKRIASYDTIWANSEFTRRWIRAYWGRESRIVYPAVEVESIRPLPKKNWILSVGRFFVALHNKKHLVIIDAFKELCRQGLNGWELHLAGEAIDDPIHQEYLRTVQSAAHGYPIYLHINAPLEELRTLYGEASIYWHAAGYGEDEDRHPIRSEHFGISTVEAMAGGCVPVVIDKGGQTEIITNGENGFLWSSLADLQRYTEVLVRDEQMRRAMAGAAQIRSRQFDRTHLQGRVDALLAESGLPGI